MIVNFLESLYIIFLCVQNKVLSKQKLPCMLAWAINNEILNLSLKIDSYGKIVADFCKLAERYFKNNFHQWRTKSVVPKYLARKRISPHKIKFYAYECMATKKTKIQSYITLFTIFIVIERSMPFRIIFASGLHYVKIRHW